MAIDEEVKRRENAKIIRSKLSQKKRLDGLQKVANLSNLAGAISAEDAAIAASAAAAGAASDAVQATAAGSKAIRAAGLAGEMANEGQAAVSGQKEAQMARAVNQIGQNPPPTGNAEPDAEEGDTAESPDDEGSEEAAEDDETPKSEQDDDTTESDNPEKDNNKDDLAQQEKKRYEEEQARKEAQAKGEAAEEEPYQEQGGKALTNKPSKPRSKYSMTGDTSDPEEIAWRARQISKRAQLEREGGLLRNAGQSLARGGEALAGAGRAAGTAIMSGLRAFGMLYVNPATAPWAWGITTGLICIILLLVSATGLYGASASSPNAAGKSMSTPVPAFDPILQTIASQSNVTGVVEAMTKNKQAILTALQNAETEINAGPYDANIKQQAHDLIWELRQSMEQLSTTDPKANQKLAEGFQNRVKELLGLWLASDNYLPGSNLPITGATPSNDSHKRSGHWHWCSIYYQQECDNAGHRSVFGILENQSGVPITADAIDLSAPRGTVVRAPFSGKASHDHVGDNGIFLVGANGNKAVLLHIDVTKTGQVNAGDILGTVGAGLKKPHLHFELKIGGKDIARTDSSQLQSELWTRMKKILGEQ